MGPNAFPWQQYSIMRSTTGRLDHALRRTKPEMVYLTFI
jgi:hypothetical protein